MDLIEPGTVPPVDLTPRPADSAPARKRRNRRKWVSLGVLVLVLAGGAVVITKFLTSALDYYCNVDEVGHKAGCEVGRSLRIQGTVVKGSITHANGDTDFRMSFNNVTVPVHYGGDPGGIFQDCIPVVVHGVMRGTSPGTYVFDGNEVEVKHSNDYAASTAGRQHLAQANQESVACSLQP